MINYNSTFSKEDLRGIILLFCANANFRVSQLEFEYIDSRITGSNSKQLYKEISECNDFQIINKIHSLSKKLKFSQEDKEALYTEITEMFKIDTSKYNLKLNIFRGLKRLLN